MVQPVSRTNASSPQPQQTQQPQKTETPDNNQQPKAPQQQGPRPSLGKQNQPQGDSFSGGGIPKMDTRVSPLAGTQSGDGPRGNQPAGVPLGPEKTATNPFSQAAQTKSAGVTPTAEKPGASKLESAIQTKDWAGVRSQLSNAINNGTFKAGDLQQAVAAGADLSGMDYTSLRKGELDNQSFKGPLGSDGKPIANMSKSSFSKLKGTQFENLNMESSEFRNGMSDVSFDNVQGRGSNFKSSNYIRNEGYPSNSINNVKFNNSDFSRSKFGTIKSSVPVMEASSPATLNGVQVNNSKFRSAQFGGSKIENSQFTGNSDLSYANLEGTELNNNKITESNLSGSSINYSKLSGNNFENSRFQGTTFEKASLNNNQFDKADLRGAMDLETVTANDKNSFTNTQHTGLEKLPANLNLETAGMKKSGTEGLEKDVKAILEAKATGEVFPGIRQELDKMGVNTRKLPEGAFYAPVPPLEPALDKPSTPGAIRSSTEFAPNGSGRKIAQIESTADPKHFQNSQTIMKGNDQLNGLAPNAEIKPYQYGFSYPDGIQSDNEQGLKTYLNEVGSSVLDKSTEQMNKIADDQNKPAERPVRGPGLHVALPDMPKEMFDAVSQSEGISKYNAYQDVKDYLQSGQYPNIEKAIYGDNPGQLNETQKAQKLVDYIDRHYNPTTNPDFKKALENHDKAAGHLMRQGTIPFIAMGNEHNKLPMQEKPVGAPADWKPPVNIPKGFDTNFLTYSPNVVGVAASETQGTPSLSDDRPADFSSYGNGQKNPFAMAPGTDIPMGKGGWGGYDTFGGTSAATPVAAATAALMREVNPSITPQQIIGAMQFSAVKQPGISPDAQGAGSLDIPRAVRLSRLMGDINAASPFQMP